MGKGGTQVSLRNFRLGRDTALFLAGLAGIFHETVISNVERPNLLILFGAMVGLPAFLRSDELRKSNGKDKERATT